MNYRHAYHAGNFADVLKHVVLTRVLAYMTEKPQPLRVIDVHAGIGRYDLAGIEADKTGEWKAGIARLWPAQGTASRPPALQRYLDVVASFNPGGELCTYPGSPLIARALLRRQDALVANELHPDDVAVLKAELKGAPHTRVLQLDAWTALKSLLPPPERRGVILIDPPFEAPDEFDRLASGLSDALARFATGTYLIWYPTKDALAVSRFQTRVRALGLAKLLNVTLSVCARQARPGLNETGLMLINPPYVLKDELAEILPMLTEVLAAAPGAAWRLDDWSTAPR